MGSFLSVARSRFQLAFELVEKAQILAVSDGVLPVRFNETRLAHAQRVETECILGVVFAPFVVWVVG